MTTTTLHCNCKQTSLEVEGPAILSAECACHSCRTAAGVFCRAAGGVDVRGSQGTTHFVLYRKDRVRCLTGANNIAEFRLRPDAGTRRAIATCCNSPLFLEFERGHWLSVYATLWPAPIRPGATMRTMASDFPAEEHLPDDIPNSRTQSLGFMVKLAMAWAKMGFRVPEVDYINGGLFMPDDKIEIENVNTPGRTVQVNRAKYEAMRAALLPVLPSEPPGMSVADAHAALLHQLPESLFPGGKTSGWWLKAVQLDLEAKGLIARAPRSPVRLHKR